MPVAVQARVLMMSQNRQDAKDRLGSEFDEGLRVPGTEREHHVDRQPGDRYHTEAMMNDHEPPNRATASARRSRR